MQTKESVFGLFLFLYLTANTFYLRTSDIDSVFYARVQYRIFAISLSFDQIGESYICVTYFSNKERYEGGCCERKCGSRNLCDKQRQWLLFLIFNNLIRRVTGKFYLLENSYFNVEKGSLFFAKCWSALVLRWNDERINKISEADFTRAWLPN